MCLGGMRGGALEIEMKPIEKNILNRSLLIPILTLPFEVYLKDEDL